MPIYVHRCRDCGEATEAFASISDAEKPVACEHCNSTNTQRVIGRVAYHASDNAKTARLDPKYEKMVEASMRKSASADPNRLLNKMKPYPKD